MTKMFIRVAAAIAISASLGGCAAVDSLFGLSNPPTAAQLAVLSAEAQVVICDISTAAALASTAEAAIDAGASVKGTTGKIYTVSALVCANIGGTATTTVTAPSGTAVLTK